jgi:hypothetical protein
MWASTLSKWQNSPKTFHMQVCHPSLNLPYAKEEARSPSLSRVLSFKDKGASVELCVGQSQLIHLLAHSMNRGNIKNSRHY